MHEAVWLAVLVAFLASLALFAFFELPRLVVSPHDIQPALPPLRSGGAPTAATPLDLIQARNGVRTAAVALLTALGAALATGFAGRTYYLSRRTRLDEAYARAAEQLRGGEDALCVSAIAELERIVRDDLSRHRQVMQTLAAFLRGRSREDDEDEAPSAVQAACEVLVRRIPRYDRGLVLNLAGADLRQTNMDGVSLRNAILRDARLRGAFLRASDLRGANLTNAQAASVRLDGASLDGAILDGADLQGATLDDACAQRGVFNDTVFSSTYMRGTDLRRSTGLVVRDSKISGAILDERSKL